MGQLAEHWKSGNLSSDKPELYVRFLRYLNNQLFKNGNYRLTNCSNVAELQEINQTSESRREDRREEMHNLYRLIKTNLIDFEGLMHYRDFVVPDTILLESKRYQMAYPSSKTIQYLCRLQENALGTTT